MQERIVVITGAIHNIIAINNLIIDKIHDPQRDSSMKMIDIDNDRASKVKIVLTDGAAGLLIGKGGETIQAIQQDNKVYFGKGLNYFQKS